MQVRHRGEVAGIKPGNQRGPERVVQHGGAKAAAAVSLKVPRGLAEWAGRTGEWLPAAGSGGRELTVLTGFRNS
jgi:hypothetical protein